jgi:hypothetical protein
MKRDYQSTKSSTSDSESDSHSDSDSESEILTPEILCEVGRDAVSLEYDVTMVVHISDLGVHPNEEKGENKQTNKQVNVKVINTAPPRQHPRSSVRNKEKS